MSTTRTIKVFLASSEELKADRNTFGNLIRKLDDIYEKRGIRIKLFEWEDCDAAYNNCRKQNEYNDEVRASDMFLALFYKKAGQFTLEEFDVATEEFRRTEIKPKPYVYCRDLPEGEQESEELKKFKRRLFEEIGHYWSTYNNEDSLQLHFVMQLQLVENSRLDNLKVENGEVKLDDTTVARMEHLRFAADNPDYQRMSLRLKELPSLIEEARLHVENYPDNQNFKDDLQKLVNEKSQLQKDFDQHQQLLFDTAKRIAILQGEAITNRMRRAIEAFGRGDVREANIILDEAENDGDARFEEFEKREEFRTKEINNIHLDIESLSMQTAIVMADIEVPIHTRVDKTIKLYKKADYRASQTDYDKKKHSHLLFDYAQFLYKYGLYNDAKDVMMQLLPLFKECYGLEHENTATLFNEIGLVYWSQGDNSAALEYYFKGLEIRERALGIEHPDTAQSYISIGAAFHAQGFYDKALKCYFKALAIQEKILGMWHFNTAQLYCNIGVAYAAKGDYNNALEYGFKASTMFETIFGSEHPDTASSYNNIGEAYRDIGDYDKAFEYHSKAMLTREKVLGLKHPDTAVSYNNIGLVYHLKGCFDKALEYHFKALEIWKDCLGMNHPKTAQSYSNIGAAYKAKGDYNKALVFQFKALTIREKTLGCKHPNTAESYNHIGIAYYFQNDYSKALEYLNKAYYAYMVSLGVTHPYTENVLNSINIVKKAICL